MNDNKSSAISKDGTNNTKPLFVKVFVPRDYSDGTIVKFQNKFPQELDGLVERQQFDFFITTLNEIYYKAEKMTSSTFFESCTACLSAYLLYLCIDTHYAKCMRKATAFVEEQNENVWNPKGLHITDPSERGLRVIEITIKLDESRERSTDVQQGRRYCYFNKNDENMKQNIAITFFLRNSDLSIIEILTHVLEKPQNIQIPRK